MIPLFDSVQLSQNILMPYCNLLRYNLLMEKKSDFSHEFIKIINGMYCIYIYIFIFLNCMHV